MRRFKRSARVSDLVRREVADIIMHRLKDPRVGFVTVTGVDMSDDLRNARVFISVLREEDKETVLAGLRASTGFIRAELGSRVKLRYMPELQFRVDPSVERGARIDTLLREIKDDGRTDETD